MEQFIESSSADGLAVPQARWMYIIYKDENIYNGTLYFKPYWPWTENPRIEYQSHESLDHLRSTLRHLANQG